MTGMREKELHALREEIIVCRRCPRLVAWREKVAQEKVKRFRGQDYWGKPLPGFGDARARLLIVGLAPAAHGANRTGRMFTGDRSGEWLYRSLHKFGFANQADSTARGDGLRLHDCYITAAVRCAPPQNKPTADEKQNCFGFLLRELQLLGDLRVIVALGRIAFDSVLKLYKQSGRLHGNEKRTFAHGAKYALNDRVSLIASYHPSQQNTFTGRLTEPMFDAVFQRARQELESSHI